MPESAWKFLFYLSAWSYSTYLLFGTDYPFFHDPPSVFYGRAPPRVGQVGGGLCSNSEKATSGGPMLIRHPILDVGPETVAIEGPVGQERGHLTLCQDSGRHPRGGDPLCGPWQAVRHVHRPWGLHEHDV